MNDADRTAYRDRYIARLNQFGHDPRALGWAAGKQDERFSILTSFVPLAGVRSILDVGCGFGDLYKFLCERGFTGQYTGIDFVPELVAIGRAAYPSADLRVGDFAQFAEARRFDLVVASGIFNARLVGEDNETHLAATLTKMFAICEVAAAADFLTSYVEYERADLYYASPERVFSLTKSLTRRVALSHQYMPFEFAVCLFKDDRVVDRAQFAPLPHASRK